MPSSPKSPKSLSTPNSPKSPGGPSSPGGPFGACSPGGPGRHGRHGFAAARRGERLPPVGSPRRRATDAPAASDPPSSGLLLGFGSSASSSAPASASTCSDEESDEESDEPQVRAPRQLLDVVRPPGCREARLRQLSSARCQATRLQLRQDRRERRERELWRRELGEMGQSEQEWILEAFERHAQGDAARAAPSDLVECLSDFGLVPRTDLEGRELRALVAAPPPEAALAADAAAGPVPLANMAGPGFPSFCLGLAPHARALLRHLRRPTLRSLFDVLDRDRTGRIGEWEAREALDRFCLPGLDESGLDAWERSVCEAVSRAAAETGEVTFRAFELASESVRERCERLRRRRAARIVSATALRPEEAMHHREELPHLHALFLEAGSEGDGQLEAGSEGDGLLAWEQVQVLLVGCGLLPHDASSLRELRALFDDLAVRRGGRAAFRELLALVRVAKRMARSAAQAALRPVFAARRRGPHREVKGLALAGLLAELGLQPRSRGAALQMLLEQLRPGLGAGGLSFEDVQGLVGLLRDRAAVASRFEARRVAREVGLLDGQVAELRDVFFHLDVGGSGRVACSKLPKLLAVAARSEGCVLLGPLALSESGIVDFPAFMRLFVQVAHLQKKAALSKEA